MTVPGGGLDSLASRRVKNLEAMRFFTTTTVSLGLYTETAVGERTPKSVSARVKELCQVSRIIFSHRLDGLHDLRHFVVDDALQHAVAHTIAVHDYARWQTFVVSQVCL